VEEPQHPLETPARIGRAWEFALVLLETRRFVWGVDGEPRCDADRLRVPVEDTDPCG
jgi:hypothetical protein